MNLCLVQTKEDEKMMRIQTRSLSPAFIQKDLEVYETGASVRVECLIPRIKCFVSILLDTSNRRRIVWRTLEFVVRDSSSGSLGC